MISPPFYNGEGGGSFYPSPMYLFKVQDVTLKCEGKITKKKIKLIFLFVFRTFQLLVYRRRHSIHLLECLDKAGGRIVA